jgi:pimeloyl-ACP methyl ester carboxylesterase
MSEWLPGSTSHTVDVNGITMHYEEMGDPNGPPVILLHGFPEFWYSWRHQMPALAAAGYRVIAPDQRGYNRTTKKGPYGVETLTRDIRALQEALGLERTDIVGHDWGAVVAWAFPSYYPQHTRKLVILNGPHPEAYKDACRKGITQILKSWYIFMFQIPRLPEALWRMGNYAILRKVFGELPKQYMNETDVDRYVDAISQPGALTAMINWYRELPAQLRDKGRALPDKMTRVPTCIIWGEKDTFLSTKCNDTVGKYVPDLELHYVPTGTHWVQLDSPEQVNRLLIDFLNK